MEHFPGSRAYRQRALLLWLIQQQLHSVEPIKSFPLHDQRTMEVPQLAAAVSLCPRVACSKIKEVDEENHCFKDQWTEKFLFILHVRQVAPLRNKAQLFWAQLSPLVRAGGTQRCSYSGCTLPVFGHWLGYPKTIVYV